MAGMEWGIEMNIDRQASIADIRRAIEAESNNDYIGEAHDNADHLLVMALENAINLIEFDSQERKDLNAIVDAWNFLAP